ncbi:MAG: hypothetical protein QW117_00300 [Candidatus Pacearchaeota archaeon]
MSDRINLPIGTGGLLRYDEDYPSKVVLTPAHVIFFILGIIGIWIFLKIFLK